MYIHIMYTKNIYDINKQYLYKTTTQLIKTDRRTGVNNMTEQSSSLSQIDFKCIIFH